MWGIDQFVFMQMDPFLHVRRKNMFNLKIKYNITKDDKNMFTFVLISLIISIIFIITYKHHIMG